MALRRIYFICLAVIGLWACNANNELEGTLNPPSADGYTYISINSLSSPSKNFSPSIKSWEEDLHTLRLLIFSSNNDDYVSNQMLALKPSEGGPIISEPFPVMPGLNDFVFIANEQALGADFVSLIQKIQSRDDFNAMQQQGFSLPYQIKEEDQAKGLLMYATYDKVNVPPYTAGSPHYDENNPWNFRGEEGVVTLTKAMTKIELIVKKDFEESSSRQIEQVVLKNVPSHMILPSQGAFYQKEGLHQLKEYVISKEELPFDYNKKEVGKLELYVPEYLIKSSVRLEDWVQFTAKINEGEGVFKEVEIPLLTDYETTTNKQEFVGLDGVSPNYLENVDNYLNQSLFRSVIYRTIGTIKEDFELTFEVLPWIEENYYQEWNPDDFEGEITVEKFEWSPEDRVVTEQNSFVDLSFKITAPTNAKWSIGLTNGADFAIVDSPHSGEVGKEYTIRIQPLKEPTSYFRYTDVKFYINSKELLPSKILDGNNEPLFPNLTKFSIRQLSK